LPSNILYAFLFFPIRATCPSYWRLIYNNRVPTSYETLAVLGCPGEQPLKVRELHEDHRKCQSYERRWYI
jgi:hypothetical protein